MARRKYVFKSRQEAENGWREVEGKRLAAEWLLTAVLDGRNVEVGRTSEHTVGYMVLVHSAYVYSFTNTKSIHRIAGIYDIDDTKLDDIIKGLIRFGINGCQEDYDYATLLERAKQQATGALYHAA